MKDLVTSDDVEHFSLSYMRPIMEYLNSDKMKSFVNLEKFAKNIPYNFSEVRKNTIEFYNKYFIVHDVYHVEKLFKHKFMNWYNQRILKNIYMNNDKISPFDIPVNFDGLSTLYFYIGKFDDNLLINFMEYISLTNDNGYINESYIHEISHTQVVPAGFGLNCDINDEVLPIFLEFLYNSGNTKSIKFRLKNLIDSYNSLKKWEDKMPSSYRKILIKYIESTLEAIMLYYIYDTEANTSMKTRIIDQIQEVFDGKIKTIDLLEKNGVTEDNYRSLKFIKHYSKEAD